MPIELSQGFRFGAFTAEPLNGLVAGDDGQSRHLAPKAMDVLVRLAEAAPKPVTRDDLITAVWGERYVSDEVLTHAIMELRHALGDSPTKPQYIQTIPKRGYQLLKKARPIADPTPAREGRKRRYLVIAASLVIAVLALGWFVGDFGQNTESTVVPTEADEVTVSGITVNPSRRIAVLPFADLSPDGDQEYFSDGISEEILNQLAKIRGLRVIARHSAFSFKGQNVDIPTIAAKLDVSYVLEGSVRRSGDRVRIVAQLIDAKDSSHLWSEAYDRDYSAENLIEIQSEIARAITGQLRLTLTGDDEARLAKAPTENTEAYAAYFLGRERLKRRKVAELANAVEQFSLAIELDPQFAGAYAGLADACGLYASYSGGQNEVYYEYDSYSGGPSNEHCPSSLAGREQLARKALELDPESAEAWISLGASIWELAVRMHGTETHPKINEMFQESLAAFERGLELNPTLSEGYERYGHNLMWINVYPDPTFDWIKAWQAGRWESVFDRGLELDPLSIALHARKTWYPVTVSSKEEAKWHGHRMVEIAPDSPSGYETLGRLNWHLNGRIDESIRWMSKAMEIDPQRPGFPKSIGQAYSALGDPDMALTYFDLANALTSPDAKPAKHGLLVEQAIVRLVSGKTYAHQVAELLPPSSQPFRHGGAAREGMRLGVFVDLVTGRPEDALARMELFLRECVGAKDIPVKWMNCPPHLVRVYQELGDQKAEQALSDAIVRRGKFLGDEYPAVWWQLQYAGVLATVGRTDAALDVLENLVSSGWRGDHSNRHLGFVLCCDVVFDAIRDHERFRAIAATIEADMAQQLQNVRDMERRGEIPTLEEVNAMIATEMDSPN
jgi:TolB-like protein/DNA-binding winged helix-turn-helix (wHTH) protein